MKKNVMIRIDEDLIKKAKEYGLNISKVSENALKEMIDRIEIPKSQSKHADCPENNGGSPGQIRTGVNGSKARYSRAVKPCLTATLGRE